MNNLSDFVKNIKEIKFLVIAVFIAVFLLSSGFIYYFEPFRLYEDYTITLITHLYNSLIIFTTAFLASSAVVFFKHHLSSKIEKSTEHENHIPISIIVPVYNVKEFLNECIESLISQTPSCEIILVNDASSDGSSDICDSFANNYTNIKVIHHPQNKGVSAARNTGLQYATLEYILFVDSDDFLLPNSIKNLRLDQKADIVFLPMVRFSNENLTPYRVLNPKDYDGLTDSESLAKILRSPSYNPQPGAKIVRKDFLLKHNILFMENTRGEDMYWTFDIFRYAKTVSIHPAPVYAYRMNPTSWTLNPANKISIINDLLGFLTANATEDNKEFYPQLAYQYAITLGHLGQMPDLIEHRNQIKPMAWLLEHAADPKTIATRIIYDLFGFNTTLKILGFYMKGK